jgi:hypothetical protein
MAGMPRCHRVAPVTVACATVALLGLGGCVQETKPLPTVTDAATTAAPSIRFPLRVLRSGGVAGFREELFVQSDGSVIGQTKQGQVTCMLDQESLAALKGGAAQVHATDTPNGPGGADQLWVQFGTGAGSLNIDDPKLAAAEPVVTQLLADVSAPPAKRKICR